MGQGSTKGVPIEVDGTLASNSNTLVPSVAAVKAYVDGKNTLISGTSALNFGSEQDAAVNTINSVLITNANIKMFSFIPTETTATSLDDFKLNGVTFNVENIVDGVSFDIRGTAINSASGVYTVKYLITI